MAVAAYLADKSALARLHHPAVFGYLAPLIGAGLVGTCGIIEMEVLYSARTHAQYSEIVADRRAGYEWFPMDDQVWERALDVQAQLSVQGRLRAVGIPDLLIAATAERHRLTVLHYDADFDIVSDVTGQPTHWVAAPGSVD